jgi:hypothetical protein
MENYGFTIITEEEANAMNLPDGSALFETMYNNMEQEIKKNKYMKSNVRSAINMTPEEKQISFLNRYYIFKKIRNVDVKNIKSVMDFDDDVEEEESIEYKTGSIDEYPGSPEGTPPAIQIQRAKEAAEKEKQNDSIDEYPGSPEGTPPAIQIQRAKEEAQKKKMPKKTNKKITLKEI